MAPVRRATKCEAERDADGYQTTATMRRSTRLSAAGNTSNGDLVVEKGAKNKEQPCMPVGRKQEGHEAEPDHPMPFPLDLNSHYVCTVPGTRELKDAEVTKVELAPEEKEHALTALGLVLQAACELDLSELGGLPSSLDRNRDIIWDWRSMQLSTKAYGGFAYAAVNHLGLKHAMESVSYDWTPLDSLRGILSVRKKCGFQSRLTRILNGVITKAMCDNKLLMSLAED
ncbi:MAG: hypothetical protein Q9164_007756, partial [Protoblastenia rupestris]